jgi:hypothetical protein
VVIHDWSEASQGLPTLSPRNELGAGSLREGPGLAFVVKNDTGMTIPPYLLPGRFSDYARLLLKRWRDILVELARLAGRTEPFTLGFYISAELEAAHERSDGHGDILYVNPVEVTQNPGGSRCLRKRWKFTAPGNWKLLATAIHEWTHFEGFRDHDEEFAGRATDLTSMVLQNRQRFARLFDRGGFR